MAIIDTDPQGTVNNINTHLDNIDKKLKEIADKQKPLMIAAENEIYKELKKDLEDTTAEQIKKIEQISDIPKELLLKKIRVFPNVHMIAGMMFQIIYKNAEGEIVKYGDILVNSYYKSENLGLGYQGSANGAWRRVAIKPGIEIIDAAGDGYSFAFLEKSKKILYRTGSTGEISSSDKLWISPKKYTFESPVVKMLTGRMTRYASSSSYKSIHERTLLVIITADGKIHTLGTNKFGELGTGDTYNSDYSTEFKTIELPDGARAVDGAVGFAGNMGAVIVIAELNGKRSAYSWGSNYWGWLGNNNTSTQRTPKKIFFEEMQFYKAWFTTGLYKHSNNENENKTVMQLFCSVGKDEDNQFLIGCGYNKQKQITADNTEYYAGFQKCYILGNSTQPIVNPTRVTGYPYNSTIGVITKAGDLYLSGQNYGEFVPNITSGVSAFRTFRQGTKFHDAWVLFDSNPNGDPQDSSNKVTVVMVSVNKNNLYHAGFDYVDNSNVGTTSGYDQIYNDDWISYKSPIAFASNDYDSEFTGTIIYCVDWREEVLLFRGKRSEFPTANSARGFVSIYSIELGHL